MCARVCLSLCSARWPLTPAERLPAGVTGAWEAFASWPPGVMTCPGFILILLVALSIASRWREQPHA